LKWGESIKFSKRNLEGASFHRPGIRKGGPVKKKFRKKKEKGPEFSSEEKKRKGGKGGAGRVAGAGGRGEGKMA